jgi:hypothetical protein
LGIAYVMLQRWQDAVAEFSRVNPEHLSRDRSPWFRYNKALALARVGDFQAALAELRLVPEAQWPEGLLPDKQQLEQHLGQDRPR